MWKTLLICVIAGSLCAAYGQEPEPPELVPVPPRPPRLEISPPLHVPVLQQAPVADRVLRNVGTARIAAPAEVLGEKTDHLLKAAAHLEAAGRTDEARELRQEAQLIKDSMAKRLEVLEAEVRRIRRLIGPVPSVLIEVKIVELTRDGIEKLGIDFSTLKQNARTTSDGTELRHGLFPSRVVDTDGAALKMLAALKEDGLLRTLSEPTLITLSGQRAEFCRGGEVPCPVAQDDGTVAIEYKEFGTRVELLPVVLGTGDVRLEMRARLSELDSALDVRVGKLRCPGLRVREVQTGVRMRADQTLIVGGMSQTRTSRKTTATEDADTSEEVDVLVLVTPRIVESPAAVSARVPAPEAPK